MLLSVQSMSTGATRDSSKSGASLAKMCGIILFLGILKVLFTISNYIGLSNDKLIITIDDYKNDSSSNSMQLWQKQNKTRTKEIDFIKNIHNIVLNESHQCDKDRFKYTSLLLQTLKKQRNSLKRVTSTDIEKYDKGVRIQIKGGKLYAISSRYEKLNGLFMWLSYFYRLVSKYGNIIPDTDFRFGWNDGMVYTQESNWIHHGFPFWISEGVSYQKNEEKSIYPLYFVSRGWIKFEHSRRALWIADCLYRNNIYKWRDKKNMIEFRGRDNGEIRRPLIEKVTHEYGINNPKYGYNIAFSDGNNMAMNESEEIKHKYILVLDGNSVRDAFHKNMLYGSVLFKQQSTIFKEWWYYDLKDQQHVIFYNNTKQLIDIVNDKRNIVNEWEIKKNENYKEKYESLQLLSSNPYKFYRENLWETWKIDCYMIHLIQIYNHYLYDPSTLKISDLNNLFCYDEKCKYFNRKQYDKEQNHHAFCPYDNITDRFCLFC